MSDRLVVLAAGISSRMKKVPIRPQETAASTLTDAQTRPKSMIRVGVTGTPFMDYLLVNARESGYTDIVIVISAHDDMIKKHYGKKPAGDEYKGLSISYAVQTVPRGRSKPLGTSDALLQALVTRKDWSGGQFSVCNSDNLYTTKTLSLMRHTPYKNAMADYDRSALKFDKKRIEAFAVTKKDSENFLIEIVEKPSADDIKRLMGENGRIGVSMNLFRFDFDMIFPFLENTPLSAKSAEKELPASVSMMLQAYPKSMYAYPVAEHVPDLTSPDDIVDVQQCVTGENNYNN